MKKIIGRVMCFFAKCAEKRAKDKYAKAGNTFGSAVSCLYMGECCGFEKLFRKWESRERKIIRCGYRPFDVDTFIDSGGYGNKLPEFIKREKGEAAISHAKIYKEKFLGKVKPAVDLQKVMSGQVVAGEYPLPSTKQK